MVNLRYHFLRSCRGRRTVQCNRRCNSVVDNTQWCNLVGHKACQWCRKELQSSTVQVWCSKLLWCSTVSGQCSNLLMDSRVSEWCNKLLVVRSRVQEWCSMSLSVEDSTVQPWCSSFVEADNNRSWMTRVLWRKQQPETSK